MSEEQRANPRIEEQDYALVTVKSAPEAPGLEGETFKALTKDLSATGLQFEAFVNPPKDTVLELHVAFVYPARVFNHIGRVVWTKNEDGGEEWSIGVEFTDTDRTEWLAWKTFVKQMPD